MAAKKRKKPGPIVPIKAYERIQYECLRCRTCFPSITGPQMFCHPCKAVLETPSGSDGSR